MDIFFTESLTFPVKYAFLSSLIFKQKLVGKPLIISGIMVKLKKKKFHNFNTKFIKIMLSLKYKITINGKRIWGNMVISGFSVSLFHIVLDSFYFFP